ncbi:restriction endonuclease subunit S [Polaribacter sp. AHE13PA]|uniref:restriction endonuclease subunit S n=1 Tax=Polaribacter sp. AHE13PA TaxID=2745562 RepID=UPI001C4EF094|nr:restriction endonuclease subunit S [Polaribacter sp. AHE13PA]QXP65401.1 restriction endonuclease subunit S [Polaribacter sp. AHE13PA]
MEKQLSSIERSRNIPQLRFPEFEGEWFSKKLGDISILTSSKRVYLEDYVSEGIPFFRGKEITELKNKEKPTDILYISKERYNDFKEKYGVPKKGDILVTAVGTLGNVWMIENSSPFYFKDGNLIWLKNIKEDSSFLEKLIQLNTKELIKTSIGSTQKALTMVELRKINLKFPQLQEQQKIASFLTDVDDKITKLTKKKELLEQYKKGIMQKIFNQELRFKDDEGNDFPEWEEKKLGEITKYYDGTHQTPNYVSEGIPFYSVEHVTANQFEKTKYISREVFEKENKRVRLEKGDILMTRIGNVGKARYIDWDVKASFYVSLALIKQNSSFSSKYLAQYINSVPFQRELWKRIIHVAFPIKINLGEIGKCLVQLPCVEEQTKIANFLSDIDIKIEVLNTKIENSKSFKKGLLQKMFV